MARRAVGQSRWRSPAATALRARRPRACRGGGPASRACSNEAAPAAGSSIATGVDRRDGDEGPRLRTQPGPLRGVAGGVGVRPGRAGARASGRCTSPTWSRPSCPGPEWHRVHPLLAGICGSDLSTVDGRSSRYFEDVVSFPFVPGHEVVGTLDDTDARVVIEPVLGCVARGIVPPCAACAEGRTGGCERVAFGHLAPGLQIGFCTDTGGGWSTGGLVAHEAQLHPRARHPVRRRRRDGGAHRVRGARRGGGRGRCRSHRGRPRGRDPGLVHGGRAGARLADPGRCSSARSTRTNAGSPTSSAPTWWSTPTSWPGPCGAGRARSRRRGPSPVAPTW